MQTAPKKPEAPKAPFVLVPLSVVSRRDLPANAKLLLAVIAGLTGREGYCWATNAFLAARLGVESRYVSNLLAALEAKGLVRSLILPERGNERRLYVQTEPATEAEEAAKECVTPDAQIDETPRTYGHAPRAQMTVTPHAQTCHIIDNSERINESIKESREKESGELVDSKREAENTSKIGSGRGLGVHAHEEAGIRSQPNSQEVSLIQGAHGSPIGVSARNRHTPPGSRRPGRPVRQTETMRSAEARCRSLWERAEEAERHPFREQALRHLLDAGPDAALPQAVEARAMRLFGVFQAKAWIERRRLKLPEAERGTLEDKQ